MVSLFERFMDALATHRTSPRLVREHTRRHGKKVPIQVLDRRVHMVRLHPHENLLHQIIYVARRYPLGEIPPQPGRIGLEHPGARLDGRPLGRAHRARPDAMAMVWSCFASIAET